MQRAAGETAVPIKIKQRHTKQDTLIEQMVN